MKTLFIFVALAITLVAAWMLWAEYGLDAAVWWIDSAKPDTVTQAGQWSDSFGAFNALASALGFAAVLATLWFQSEAIKEQARDQHRQRFETTFFELIRIMREMRSEIRFVHTNHYDERGWPNIFSQDYAVMSGSSTSLVNKDKRFSGYEAISEAVKEVRFWIIEANRSGQSINLAKIYNSKIQKSNEATLSPYFRIIYRILQKLRLDNTLSKNEKVEFGNLLRSQLTSDEIMLMAVNGLSAVSKDFNTLLTKFRMLKYLPKTSVRSQLEKEYNGLAFQPRD